MKRNLARQHSRHRDRTPSVICLPPPKPPVVEKKTMALPDPALADRTEARSLHTPRPSRQARRKALRDEAKVQRSQQQRKAPGSVALQSDAPASAMIEPAPAAEKTLPCGRSLALAKPRGLALFTHRLRLAFGLRKASPERDGTMASQLRALRADLAALQQSLDRMIESATA